MKPLHPLDLATTLTRVGPERYAAKTSDAYANMTGPFGGFTAAILLRAVMEDERKIGDPIALTVNYCAPIAAGPFEISCRERRTGKSTQHWSLELTQGDRVGATATVVCGVRRDVWTHRPEQMPVVPSPEQVKAFDPGDRFGWFQRYEMRFIKGALDFNAAPPQELREPVTQVWLRDRPDRTLDYMAAASICDAFIVRAFVVRGTFTPIGTVSLTTFFHADEAAMRAQGSQHLLGVATANIFNGGFFDQTAHLWGRDGTLLATSTQVVWYRD